jgi:uncharacterized 2Fe-2S/4Fe-4S cluster protein (DUF4445 family)
VAIIRVILQDNTIREISAGEGTGLIEALRSAGVYFPAVCGGRGACGKCALRVTAGVLPVTAADESRFSGAELTEGWRLACAAFPAGDITVIIPEIGDEHFSALDSFAGASVFCSAGGGAKPLYAAAVDIGTTTLGFALVDLRTGAIAGRFSAVNKQREFGGDVISRIQRACGGDLSLLCRRVRGQIAAGIAALCAEAGAAGSDISRIAIVGNTTMLHLLLGLSCETLGRAPFTPVTLELIVKQYGDIFEGGLSCEVVILPGISAYVGADIVSGLLFTEPHRRGETAAFMDIGTNGEIALVQNGKIFCAATAAGPAFEGGNILWGTGSVPGAVSRVWFNGGVFEVSTIGGRPPSGICGSGVVDMAYRGLKHGYILPSGRFSEKVKNNEIFLARAPDGRDIVYCQKDVRELQLAKSAVRTGLDALLNHGGLGYDDIQTLYIAGGFGFNLDMESAAGIGLIPEALLPRVLLVGNSALGGAVKYLLNPEHDKTLHEIIERSTEFSLPEDEFFKANFIDNINFPA